MTRLLAALVLSLLCFVPVGCQTAETSADDLDTTPADDAMWTIAVDAFEGPNQLAEARMTADRYRRSTNLPEFFVQPGANERTFVYYGRYTGDDDARAIYDVKKLRALREARYISPRLLTVVPLESVPAEKAKPLDLRNAVDGAIYTLQVAVYDAGYDGDFREAAERKASQMRARGYDAYFYHGPNRSMVTIGAFARGAFVDDNDPATPLEYHPYIRGIQETYPHNLRNDKPLVEGNDPRTGQPVTQPSFLVRIPNR